MDNSLKELILKYPFILFTNLNNMSGLCFDIDTEVSVSNGIDMKELGAILQNFTSKFLYVTGGQLYGVDNVKDINPCHRLIRFERCFQLICRDNQTMLYCFRKELADHLNQPPVFQESSEINDTMAQSRINETSSLIAAIRMNRESKRPLKTGVIKPDFGYPHKRSKYNPITSKGKEEESSNTDSDSSESVFDPTEPKVCAIVANLLRKKAANQQTKTRVSLNPDNNNNNTYESEDNDSLCETVDSDIKMPVIMPIVPRMFKDNVKLSSLPVGLQNAVVDKVMEMNYNDLPAGTLYFNGSTFSVLVDGDNLFSLYDCDNLLNVERLRPNCYNGNYDGTPGSLPIAQFRVHQCTYKVYVEPKKAETVSEYQGRLTKSMLTEFEEFGFSTNDIKCGINAILSENPKDITFGSCDVEVDSNENISIFLTVLKCRGFNTELESFWPSDINTEYTLIYRLVRDGDLDSKDEVEIDYYSLETFNTESSESDSDSSGQTDNTERSDIEIQTNKSELDNDSSEEDNIQPEDIISEEEGKDTQISNNSMSIVSSLT